MPYKKPYSKKPRNNRKIMRRRIKKNYRSKYRGAIARIPQAIPLKPKSVCQKLVYYNSFHCVPGLDLNGNQQNYFFTIAINSPWLFIDQWNAHAINNNRFLNPNSDIQPLNASHQPDANTTAMPGLKDGYDLFHQYQNGVVLGTKIVLTAQPTAQQVNGPAQQAGVLYAVRHAKADFGLTDSSDITDIQKLPFRQMKRIAGSNDSLDQVGAVERNTGASITVKHSTKKFNNVQSLRDNDRFQFKQASSLHLYGQTPEDSDFLTVGITPSLKNYQGGARKAPDFKLSMRVEQTVMFSEPLENLGEGTGNYSLPWAANLAAKAAFVYAAL